MYYDIWEDKNYLASLNKESLHGTWRAQGDHERFQLADSWRVPILKRKISSRYIPPILKKDQDNPDAKSLIFSGYAARIFLDHYVMLKNPKNLKRLYKMFWRRLCYRDNETIINAVNSASPLYAKRVWKTLTADSDHKPAEIIGYWRESYDLSMTAIIKTSKSEDSFLIGIDSMYLQLIQREFGKKLSIKTNGYNPVLFYRNTETVAAAMPIKLHDYNIELINTIIQENYG